MSTTTLRRAAFFVLCALCFCPLRDSKGVFQPLLSPPLALAAGLALALLISNPYPKESKRLSGTLLRVCVVMLGFSMDLGVVLRAGAQGMVFAAVTICATLTLGWLVGKWLSIRSQTSALISAGTAICGGSAIAAVGSVINAAEGEMSVALATVFMLNAVALYLFPIIGHALSLSQAQFGTWAGVAIHDISSVVGASSIYGLSALQTATAVKLSRSLWIVPMALAAALLVHRGSLAVDSAPGEEASPKQKLQVPWFIAFFLLAALAKTSVPQLAPLEPSIHYFAAGGLGLTLFLIGAGLSKAALRTVGWRPLVQGVILWAFISVVSLTVIRQAL